MLSRGDRRCADLLESAWREHGGDVRRALAAWPHDPAFFARREIGVEERLPWDLLDLGLDKAFLAREHRRGPPPSSRPSAPWRPAGPAASPAPTTPSW